MASHNFRSYARRGSNLPSLIFRLALYVVIIGSFAKLVEKGNFSNLYKAFYFLTGTISSVASLSIQRRDIDDIQIAKIERLRGISATFIEVGKGSSNKESSEPTETETVVTNTNYDGLVNLVLQDLKNYGRFEYRDSIDTDRFLTITVASLEQKIYPSEIEKSLLLKMGYFNIAKAFSKPMASICDGLLQLTFAKMNFTSQKYSEVLPILPDTLGFPFGFSSSGDLLFREVKPTFSHGCVVGKTQSGKSNFFQVVSDFNRGKAKFFCVDFKAGAFAHMEETELERAVAYTETETRDLVQEVRGIIFERIEAQRKGIEFDTTPIWLLWDEYRDDNQKSPKGKKLPNWTTDLKWLISKGAAYGFTFLFTSQRSNRSSNDQSGFKIDPWLLANVHFKVAFALDIHDSRMFIQSPLAANLAGQGDGILIADAEEPTRFQSLLFDNQKRLAPAHSVDSYVSLRHQIETAFEQGDSPSKLHRRLDRRVKLDDIRDWLDGEVRAGRLYREPTPNKKGYNFFKLFE